MSHWYRKDEPASIGIIRIDGDLCTYRTGESTTDRQAETYTFLEIVCRLLKEVEDTIPVIWFDAHAGILHYQPDLTTLAADVAPADLSATSITANAATISWTGYGESYNLRYSKGGVAKVTLSVSDDVWNDGTGYQMLLDDTHNTCGTVIPETGGLTGSEFNGGELTLNFTTQGAVTTIEAGVPYIIKWNNTGVHLTEANLVFPGVTVESSTNDQKTDYVDFKGTFSPVGIYESSAEKTKLYLGEDNTLYYPTSTDIKVNACRAWFQLKGLTAGTPATAVRSFILNFSDDEKTGIKNLQCSMFNRTMRGTRSTGASSRASRPARASTSTMAVRLP